MSVGVLHRFLISCQVKERVVLCSGAPLLPGAGENVNPL